MQLITFHSWENLLTSLILDILIGHICVCVKREVCLIDFFFPFSGICSLRYTNLSWGRQMWSMACETHPNSLIYLERWNKSRRHVFHSVFCLEEVTLPWGKLKRFENLLCLSINIKLGKRRRWCFTKTSQTPPNCLLT